MCARAHAHTHIYTVDISNRRGCAPSLLLRPRLQPLVCCTRNADSDMLDGCRAAVQIVPFSLTAPSDQDVRVEISPELADRLNLDTTSIIFLAGETGPKQFELYAPDDGIFLGETPTELEFVFSSTNPGYNGLVATIPVKITEERIANILVRASPINYLFRRQLFPRCSAVIRTHGGQHR